MGSAQEAYMNARIAELAAEAERLRQSNVSMMSINHELALRNAFLEEQLKMYKSYSKRLEDKLKDKGNE